MENTGVVRVGRKTIQIQRGAQVCVPKSGYLYASVHAVSSWTTEVPCSSINSECLGLTSTNIPVSTLSNLMCTLTPVLVISVFKKATPMFMTTTDLPSRAAIEATVNTDAVDVVGEETLL